MEVAPMSMPDEADRAGQADEVRAATTPRGREPLRLDQPQLGEPVELDGHLRLRQLDGLAELGARGLSAVAEQAQQAGLVGVLGSGPDSVHRTPPVGCCTGRLRANATAFGFRREDFVHEVLSESVS
jgi:hypothetical protein